MSKTEIRVILKSNVLIKLLALTLDRLGTMHRYILTSQEETSERGDSRDFSELTQDQEGTYDKFL